MEMLMLEPRRKTKLAQVVVPFTWAVELHGEDHAVTEFLKSNGAKNVVPGQVNDEL
jgi:hypothetical protein